MTNCCGRDLYELDFWLPILLALQFLGLAGLIVAFARGEFGGAIPKQYYAKPWGGEAVTNVMGLEVNGVGKFFGVFFAMLVLSFVSALTARAMSIWEWDMVNFSNPNGAVNEYKKKYLWIVSFCGTFFLSITSVVNLFFSVTSLYYLFAAAFGRVFATLMLNRATQHVRKDAAQNRENGATNANGGPGQKMFRKYR